MDLNSNNEVTEKTDSTLFHNETREQAVFQPPLKYWKPRPEVKMENASLNEYSIQTIIHTNATICREKATCSALDNGMHSVRAPYESLTGHWSIIMSY